MPRLSSEALGVSSKALVSRRPLGRAHLKSGWQRGLPTIFGWRALAFLAYPWSPFLFDGLSNCFLVGEGPIQPPNRFKMSSALGLLGGLPIMSNSALYKDSFTCAYHRFGKCCAAALRPSPAWSHDLSTPCPRVGHTMPLGQLVYVIL